MDVFEGVLTVSGAGVILNIDASGANLLGYADPSDLLGKNADVLIAAPFQALHSSSESTKTWHRALTSEPGGMTQMLHKEGWVIPVRVALSDCTNEDLFVFSLKKTRPRPTRLVIGLDGTIAYAERGTGFGYREHELVGKNVSTLVPDSIRERHATWMEMYNKTGKSDLVGKVRNLQMRESDGTHREISLHVVKNENGDPLRAYDVQIDSVDVSIEAILILDEQGIIKSCSRSWIIEMLLGFAAGDLLGKHIGALAPSFFSFPKSLQNWMSSNVTDVVHRDGSIISAQVVVESFHVANGTNYSCRMKRLSNNEKLCSNKLSVPGLTMGALLGKGAYGSVFVATLHNSNPTMVGGDNAPSSLVVAVKILPRNQTLAAREIDVLQRISHQNVCNLIRVITTNDHIALVTDFCSGGEIGKYIASRRKLEEDECRHYFSQLTNAISYIHNLGIFHRDIKTENVLLVSIERDWSKNVVKLADFGLSKVSLGEGERQQTFCGTPRFAAPEMLLAQDYEGPEVDVWSVTVLLYVMATGKFPFPSISSIVTCSLFRTEEPVSHQLLSLFQEVFREKRSRVSLTQVMQHDWMLQNSRVVLAQIVDEQHHDHHQLVEGAEGPMKRTKVDDESM